MRIGLRSPAISNFKDEFSEAASACLAEEMPDLVCDVLWLLGLD